jgi:RHS repeat-associated protein
MSTALRTYYRGRNLVTMRDEAAGQSRVYHFDHQGTTQCLTDQAGAVTDRFAADAWGVQVKRTGASINRHWYIGNSGYLRQTDLTVDYARSRWLRAPSSRWLSRDPVGFARPPQAAYTYASNSPGARIDPTGQFTVNLYHFFVEGAVRPFDAVARYDNAVRIWNNLAPGGQISIQASYQRPDVPARICVCSGGTTPPSRKTVDVRDWHPGESLLARLVTTQWIAENYHLTNCDGEFVIWTGTNPDEPNEYADTTYPFWNNPHRLIEGVTFWWESHLQHADAFAKANQGGILAHELGHGLFGLRHAGCGLMYGYIGAPASTRWSPECLDLTSVRRLEDAWQVRVPKLRHCQGHEPMYGIKCGPPEGGSSKPQQAPIFMIIGAGTCQLEGYPCCLLPRPYPCP